jgi:hypothetical protein
VSKPKAKQPDFLEPTRGSAFSTRFVVALVLMIVGIAWMAYYYAAVRVDPLSTGKAGSPGWIADLGDWNYLIGFGLLFVGLAVAAHPDTPLGRGRGVVVGMLGCFVIGLLWICTFYVISNNIDALPVFDDLGQKNLLVGVGFMAIGFVYATRWE